MPLNKAATNTLATALDNPLQPTNADLVFWGDPGRDGQRRPYEFRSAWKMGLGRAEIPGLRFRDLRHEAVSRLVEAGLGNQEVNAINKCGTSLANDGPKRIVVDAQIPMNEPISRCNDLAPRDRRIGYTDSFWNGRRSSHRSTRDCALGSEGTFQMSPHIMIMALPAHEKRAKLPTRDDPNRPLSTWVMAAVTPLKPLLVHLSHESIQSLMTPASARRTMIDSRRSSRPKDGDTTAGRQAPDSKRAGCIAPLLATGPKPGGLRGRFHHLSLQRVKEEASPKLARILRESSQLRVMLAEAMDRWALSSKWPRPIGPQLTRGSRAMCGLDPRHKEILAPNGEK